jgi:hypothetical protein
MLEQSGIINWLTERLADSRAQDQLTYPDRDGDHLPA